MKRRNPPRRSLQSHIKNATSSAAKAEAYRRLERAHLEEFEQYLNEERARFGLPPIKRRVNA